MDFNNVFCWNQKKNSLIKDVEKVDFKSGTCNNSHVVKKKYPHVHLQHKDRHGKNMNLVL